MKISEIYRQPKTLSKDSLTYHDVDGQMKTITPLEFDLIKKPDGGPAVFDPDKIIFYRTRPRKGGSSKHEIVGADSQSLNIFTPEFRQIAKATGIYAWWSPQWGFYNIGLAASSDSHPLYARTWRHLMQSVKPPTDDKGLFSWKLFQQWMTPNRPGEELSAEQINNFFQQKLMSSKLSNAKFLYWVVPNLQQLNPVAFKAALLKKLETDLTVKHSPITNKEAGVTSRTLKTLDSIKSKLQGNDADVSVLKSEIVDLVDEFKDLIRLLGLGAGTTKQKNALQSLKAEFKNLVRGFKSNDSQLIKKSVEHLETLLKN